MGINVFKKDEIRGISYGHLTNVEIANMTGMASKNNTCGYEELSMTVGRLEQYTFELEKEYTNYKLKLTASELCASSLVNAYRDFDMTKAGHPVHPVRGQ